MNKKLLSKQLNRFNTQLNSIKNKGISISSLSTTFKKLEEDNIKKIFSPLINPKLNEPFFLEANLHELKVFVNNSLPNKNKEKIILFKIVFNRLPPPNPNTPIQIKSFTFTPYFNSCVSPLDYERFIFLGKLAESLNQKTPKLIKKLNLRFQKLFNTILNKSSIPFQKQLSKYTKTYNQFFELFFRNLVNHLSTTPYILEEKTTLAFPSYNKRFNDIKEIKVTISKNGMVAWKLIDLNDPTNPLIYTINLPKDNKTIAETLIKTVGTEKLVLFMLEN